MPVVPDFSLPNPHRRRTYAVLRSLVAMTRDSVGVAGATESRGQIVINFPTMPDSIELSRRVNYYNAVKSPITPDGFHVYESTDPLSIPITFTLNAYDDDFCTEQFGPLILLTMAAKLHALAMPIRSGDRNTRLASAPSVAASDVPNGASDAQVRSNTLRIGTGDFTSSPALDHFFFPPACALQVIMGQVGGGTGLTDASNSGSLGLNCVGFVSDVRVVFKGPWLQGSFSDDGARNLPTEAEFSFTFVHQPGYTNNVLGANFTNDGGPSLITTTALDIYQRLYNTIDISNNVSYAGLLSPTPGL